MAAKKTHDLAVVTGKYSDRDGNQKSRYQNVGALMQSDDGSQFIMLAKWFNPAGITDFSGRNSESVLISVFEPRQDQSQAPQNAQQQRPQQQRPQQRPQQQQGYDYDSDVPF